MAMVYDRSRGPAWRNFYGGSAEAWDDSPGTSYGTRYETAASAGPRRASVGGRMQAVPYVEAQGVEQNPDDLVYARQAKVLGSTANYLMRGYAEDKASLLSLLKDGDLEGARLVADRMKRWRDEHVDSLTEWTAVGNGKKGIADNFARSASELLSDAYLDEPVATVTGPGGQVQSTETARQALAGATPEARARAVDRARQKLGLGAEAAAVYADKENPLYDSLLQQRINYNEAVALRGSAKNPEQQEAARRGMERAALSLKKCADFASRHSDDPSAVKDFLSGLGSSSWFENVAPAAMDDLYGMYRADVEQGRVRNSADWFGDLVRSLESMRPVQNRIVPGDGGRPKVVSEPSERTRADTLPGVLMATRDGLAGYGRDYDVGQVASAAGVAVQKADVLARMLQVNGLEQIGRGDAAVSSAIYNLGGRDPAMLHPSRRGTPLATSGEWLDDSYASAVVLAGVMGVNLDESTPVNGAASTSPGRLGPMQLELYRAILRNDLSDKPDPDALLNDVAGILSVGLGDRSRDYVSVAEAVLGIIDRNRNQGIKMDLEQVLREVQGSLRVDSVRTQDGQDVPVVQPMIPSGARMPVDYATGTPMKDVPDETDTAALSTDAERRKHLENASVFAADQALASLTRPGGLPYEDALVAAGKSTLVDAVKSAAEGILSVHRAVDYATGSGSTRDLAPAMGFLLADNLERNGFWLTREERAFVRNGLIQYLDGHDKGALSIKGDDQLNERAARFADSLADSLGSRPGTAGLFARLAVELMNRGQRVGESTRNVLTTLGVVKPHVAAPMPGAGASFPDVARISDDVAAKRLTQLNSRLLRYYNDKEDVLSAAGYKDHAVGMRRLDNDYTGIFRQFDLAWRAKAPVTTPVQTQDVRGSSGPSSETAATAGYILASKMSVDDELSNLVTRYVANISWQFDDSKALEHDVALVTPMLREKLRSEGYDAVRAYVDRQGAMRDYAFYEVLDDQTKSFRIGHRTVTKGDWDRIVMDKYGGDEAALKREQARVRELESKQDETAAKLSIQNLFTTPE